MRLEHFQMIDTVDALDMAGGTVRVVSRVPDESPVFEGHFPSFPTLPGVMMLEMINHAAGYLIFMRHQQQKFVFLGSVKRAKFRQFVKPGAVAEIDAKITHDGSGFAVAEGTITVAGTIVADAEIVMIVSNFPNPELAAAFKRHFALVPVSSSVGG